MDIRWYTFALKNGLGPNGEVPAELFTDIRQNIRHQDSNGGVMMLTNSAPYHYHSDRCCVPREHLAHLGWPLDVAFPNARRAIDRWPKPPQKSKKKEEEQSVQPSEKKKAKTPKPLPQWRRGHEDTFITTLAGNGVALPDLCMISYTAQLAMESSLWPNEPPSVRGLRDILAPLSNGPPPSVVLDPDMSATEIKKYFGDGSESDGNAGESDGESDSMD